MPITDSERSRSERESRSLLRTYVNDHRAGAAAGVALVRRCERNNRGSALGVELRAVRKELEEDEATLRAVADQLSLRDDPLKRVLSRAAEAIGRLKSNGRVLSYSPLSRLVELELLLTGIDAKRSLWRSLSVSTARDLPAFDFAELERRAAQQRAVLMPFHRDAAAIAFPSSDIARAARSSSDGG